MAGGGEVATFRITAIADATLTCRKIKTDGTEETTDTTVYKPAALDTSTTDFGNGMHCEYDAGKTRRKVSMGTPVTSFEYVWEIVDKP